MTIKKQAVEKLWRLNTYSDNEIGGVLGSTDNQIIDVIQFDETSVHNAYSYSPNTKYLNAILLEWNRRGIAFMGMFHSHLFGIKQLSEKDKCYIKKILSSIHAENTTLYFPILVLPSQEIITYAGKKSSDGITIFKEDVKIIP